MLRVEVPVAGEPPANVVWFLDGKNIMKHERIHIENEDYITQFVIRKAVRKDKGEYLIKAENEYGKDEATLELVVIGKWTHVLLFNNNTISLSCFM